MHHSPHQAPNTISRRRSAQLLLRRRRERSRRAPHSGSYLIMARQNFGQEHAEPSHRRPHEKQDKVYQS
ncbi:hypothetical protein U9M48_027580 [Paspalum notatum var. saurae]|uniref:Uncharacterized protein n=1 Tax=Paspalum notatum var. saurae TaxID=547442 RepID=A0AAQ3TV48_PASNO